MIRFDSTHFLSMETLEQIEVNKKISTLFIDSEGVLIVKVVKSFVSLGELDKDFIQIKAITKGSSICGIIEIENNGELGKNYLSYLEREYSKIYKALAIITTSKWMRFKSVFKRSFSKNKYPVKLFSNNQQAKLWLKGFL